MAKNFVIVFLVGCVVSLTSPRFQSESPASPRSALGRQSFPLVAVLEPSPLQAAEPQSKSTKADPTPPPTPQTATVVLPKTLTARPNKFFCLKAKGNCKTIRWIIPDTLDQLPPEIQLNDKHAVVLEGPTGTYSVSAYGALGDDVSELATCVVTIGTPPDPPPPGPGPGPGPNPPVPPGPTPTPAPIPAAGLHVLVILGSKDIGSLPASQADALRATEVRQYLNAHCPNGDDGKTKEWRIWDEATDPSQESKLWQDAFRRPHKSTPWIIVSNPDKGGGFEGPLPKDSASLLALLKQYGGD